MSQYYSIKNLFDFKMLDYYKPLSVVYILTTYFLHCLLL